jgi:DNA-binding winged helix-turn-helix (wHTH) protein
MAADGRLVSGDTTSLLRFDSFELDIRSGQLWRAGILVDLPPQALKILGLLAARPNALVPRNEIKQVLWPNEAYGDFDSRLNFAVRKLREALNDDAEQPRYIRTVRSAGYMFVAPVREQATVQPQALPVELAKTATVDSALQSSRWWNRESNLFKPGLRLATVTSALILVAAGVALAFRWQGESQTKLPPPSPTPTSQFASHDPGDTMEIFSVTPILPTAKQRIVIRGRGFGLHVPYARTDSPYLAVRNQSAHWAAGRVIAWNWDEVMLDVESWTNSEIVISGFCGDYGRNGWKLNAGDQLQVAVWNPQSGSGPALFETTVGNRKE